MKSKYQCTFEY